MCENELAVARATGQRNSRPLGVFAQEDKMFPRIRELLGGQGYFRCRPYGGIGKESGRQGLELEDVGRGFPDVVGDQ